MRALLEDLRFARRALARNPRYTFLLVFVLAFGIGATTTVFAVLHSVLLRPLPYPHADRLVILGGAVHPYLDMWRSAEAFAHITIYDSGGANLTGPDTVERITATVADSEFFPVFAVSPQLGRTFRHEEETPGRHRVAVLSHGLWQRAFGGRQDVLGQDVRLNGIPHTVVGVMPIGFAFPAHTDVWVPRPGDARSNVLRLGADKERDLPLGLSWNMLGRLREGVTLEQAQAQIRVVDDRVRQIQRAKGHGIGSRVNLFSLHGRVIHGATTPLVALFAAAGFLLLIACANGASLLLARAATRTKEMAIRRSLGASRWRIARLLVTESALLSCAAGALGVVLAYQGAALIRAFGPADLPRLREISVDPAVLGFTLGVTLLIGLGIGLAPALQAARQDVLADIKAEGPSLLRGSRQRVRKLLLAGQVAVGMVLLTGAVLAMQSLARLLAVPPGFDPRNVVTLQMALPETMFEAEPGEAAGRITPAARSAAIYRAVLEDVRNLPGVVAAGVVDPLPLAGMRSGGQHLALGEQYLFVRTSRVQGDYFRAMGIPLLAGELFPDDGAAGAGKTVIISQTTARALGGEPNPLGKQIEVGGESREVIGIVGDSKCVSLDEPPCPHIYFPVRMPYRGTAASTDLTLVVRTASAPESVGRILRNHLASRPEELGVFRVRTMEEVVADSAAAYRFRGVLLGGFAAGALLLVALAVYGVASYAAEGRTREVGIRVALGAQPPDIRRLILREGTRTAVAGIAAGLLGAFWLTRLIGKLLFGVGPADPLSYAAAAVLLGSCVVLGGWLPARRASRADPARALRFE